MARLSVQKLTMIIFYRTYKKGGFVKIKSNALWWVAGVFFTIGGLGLAREDFVSGFLTLLAGLICFPLVRKSIFLKFRIKNNNFLSIGLVFVLFTIAAISTSNTKKQKATNLGFTSIEEYREAISNDAKTKEEWDKKKREIAKEKFAIELKKYEKSKAERIAKDEEEKKCRQDVQCWADRNMIQADVYCQEQIERLAKYESRWSDEFLENKFDRAEWKNKDKGIVSYVGDKIQLQNGFGSYQNHIYRCDYDTLNEQVINVSIFSGHL